MSAEFKKACDLDDVWEGDMDVFDIDGQDVLIVHGAEGEIRAYDPICPHQEHPLIEGDLENCILTCSAHLWQFDVISGKGVNPTGTSLIKFPIEIKDDAIWVAFPENNNS